MKTVTKHSIFTSIFTLITLWQGIIHVNAQEPNKLGQELPLIITIQLIGPLLGPRRS